MSLKSIFAHAKKHVPVILIGITTILVMAYLGFFTGKSNYCYDLFFRLRGPVSPEPNIIIVAVDEKTLNAYGQWPLDRGIYAELLVHLDQARIIGIDILMPEPTAADNLLATAIKKHGRVILPVYIAKNNDVIRSSSVFFPLGTGHIHLEPDIDNVVRSVFHTLYLDDERLPSFSSFIYEKSSFQSFSRTINPYEHKENRVLPRIIQMDPMKINYYGPQGTFPCLSLADVMDGRFKADFFNDKIVLVGVTAEGLDVNALTPFSQKRNHMSGVETHAHILGNLLDGRQVLDTPNVIVWFLSLGLSFLCILFVLRCHGFYVILSWIAGIMGVFVISFFFFAFLNIWFNPVPFVLLMLFMFFLAYIFRMEETGKQLTEAKELWEDTFNTIDDAIVVMDSSGKVLQKNLSAETLLSDPSLCHLLTGQYILEVNGIPNQNPLNCLNNTFSKPVVDEITDKKSDRHFVVKKIFRYCGNLQYVGSVMIIQDISERKKATREKQRMESELMQAQKMEAIGTLAGGVAHDFNNILMGIQGYTTLLMLDSDKHSPLFDYLEKIESQVQSAAGLTRQLLGFARGGKYEVQSINLNELLEISSDVFGRTKKEITISKRYEKDIWFVMADKGQVEQVLINMYINSWHAMSGGGTLFLESQNVILNNDIRSHGLKAGKYVKISITDTGQGMDESTRKRVFEPFFTTKERLKGTGLGMASAYGIVKNHGGFIDVFSEVGKGSSFHIYFPAAKKPEIMEEKVTPNNIGEGQETILVVDDEPVNIKLMKELLERLGYQVLCANSGQEAVAIYLAKKENIDLIILDMIMPGMGGGSTFDALRDIKSDARVILSSGYSIDGEARKILDRGCNGFIQKPFLVKELTRKIREVLTDNK